jgi:hypothetical protein
MRQDHEDVTMFGLDADREQELRRKQKECVFTWTNKAGEPVGVVMNYLDTPDGHVWLTLSEQRPRFAAIVRDPRTCVVITSTGTDMGPGKTVTYKGLVTVHDKADRGVKDWFFRAFAEKLNSEEGEARILQFMRLLDSPRRVVIEFIPTKSIVFDDDKHRAADGPPEDVQASVPEKG